MEADGTQRRHPAGGRRVGATGSEEAKAEQGIIAELLAMGAPMKQRRGAE
jgi:hypothetical protein